MVFRDPHSEPGNNCPRNYFDLSDYTALEPLETPLVHKRQVELAAKGITGKFDPAHLRSIHKYLFQDVFPWAGELRVVNIAKPGSMLFCLPEHISTVLTETCAVIAREDYLSGLIGATFAERAGWVLGEINAVHPFREGNGRAQREFVRQLALQAGHPLSWAGFTQAEMVEASIRSHTAADNSQLAALLDRALYANRA